MVDEYNKEGTGKDNPWLMPEDFWSGYSDSMKEAYGKDFLDYQSLTYRVFNTKDGKEWLAKTKINMQKQFVKLGVLNADLQLAHAQGEREAILKIEQFVEAHEMYIKMNKG